MGFLRGLGHKFVMPTFTCLDWFETPVAHHPNNEVLLASFSSYFATGTAIHARDQRILELIQVVCPSTKDQYSSLVNKPTATNSLISISLFNI